VNLGLDNWFIFGHSDASRQAMMYAIEFPKACGGIFIVGATSGVEDKTFNADFAARRKKRSHESWYRAAVRAEQSRLRSNEDFRQSFLFVQLPLYFASYDAALDAQHYFSASTYHVIGNEYDKFAPEFHQQVLKEISVPTAAFIGDSDLITTPLDSKRIIRGIAKPKLFTKLFEIRRAGHFPWIEQPKAFFHNFAQANRVISRARR
jgi:pimeloyl-ACP methyl ester carboxylesterase